MAADEVLAVLQSPTGGRKSGLRLARAMVSDLAARVADAGEARRIATQLNDAYLRLQFAYVTDDLALIQRERRACTALVEQARRATRDGGRPEARPKVA